MLAVVNSTKDSMPELDDFMPFFNQKDEESEDDGVGIIWRKDNHTQGGDFIEMMVS